MVLRQIICLLIFICCTATSWATLNLQLTQGISKPIPITVLSFSGTQGLPDAMVNPTTVIKQDLRYSGHFKFVDESLLSNLANQPLKQFNNWGQVQTNAVLKGRVKKLDASGHYEITFKLINVFSSKHQQKVHHDNYQVIAQDSWRFQSNKQLLDLSHKVANQVFSNLTGQTGYFNDHIAYTAVHLPDLQDNNKRDFLLGLADYDGRNKQELAHSSQPILSPTWSPGGQHIAYIDFLKDGRSAIRVINLKNHHIRTLQVTKRPLKSGLAWSPDAHYLAFAMVDNNDHSQIYVRNLVTDTSRQVTHSATDNYAPAWLDKNHLLMTSNANGSDQVYVMAWPHGKLKPLTHSSDSNTSPQASAKSKWIAVLHHEQDQYNVQWVNRQNNAQQVLTSNNRVNSFGLAPNNLVMAYSAVNAQDKPVMHIQPLGKNQSLVWSALSSYRLLQPAWQPGQHSHKEVSS